MKIFKSIEHDNKSTEELVLNKLDLLFEEGKIGHLNNKEELIRFLFKIYFYKRTLRPYIPILDYIFRLIIIIILIIMIGLAMYGSLHFNTIDTLNTYREKWIILSNVMYFTIVIYIPVRIYSYIRLLLRNEIEKKYGYTFLMGFFKFIGIILFISFTWFLGNLFGSLYNIVDVSISELIK